MPAKPRTVFEPPEEQKHLFPDISGNTVNGLGEEEFRRPRHIYWQRPDKLVHGALQQYIVDKFTAVPALRDIYAGKDARGPRQPDPVAAEQAQDTPENWSRRLKEFALAHESDMVGITRLEAPSVYEGYEVADAWVVVLGLTHDYEALATAPSSDDEPTSALEVAEQYNRGARTARAVANWIRAQGYNAEAHAGPWVGSLLMTSAALASGFGELGKHGSIINPKVGSAFRLAGVTTDIPLVADPSVEFGADDFCQNCQICTDACPPDAIFREKQIVRGQRKWFVNFDKCVSYFNETHGCGICIAVCPWSRPGVAPNLAAKLARRRARQAPK